MVVWLLLCVVTVQLGPSQAGRPPLLKCPLGFRMCTDGLDCVPYRHVCDGESDCSDGSDEEGCAEACTAGQFQCSHGKKCIDQKQVCDGESQCQDRSDELSCTKHTEDCTHQCDNKRLCLPDKLICDGEKDCVDGSDEANCGIKEEEKKADAITAGPFTSRSSRPNMASDSIKCNLGSKPCTDLTECVHNSHVCDGEADCIDGSDEEGCSTSCETGQFQCAHGKKCIDQRQLCDGVSQCQDRSDELSCTKRLEGCSHQCDEGSRCLPDNLLCDGEKDCMDGSDEANCADEGCGASEFKCTSGQCISASLHCDGHPDCKDRSDEEGCTKLPVCNSKQRCPQSKECLVPEWICDGDQDCKDGSDEKDCPVTPLTCGHFQWSCASKTKCVPVAWRCDGIQDCDDGSDETQCGTATCSPYQFQCGSAECLDMALVCNTVNDCADGSDEGGSCETRCLAQDAARCSQTCYSTPQGLRCGCEAGFRLLQDGLTCVERVDDECEGQGICSHMCINTPGSYHCQCHPGYVMEVDGHHCKITGEPFLLSSVQTGLFLYGLRSGSLDVLQSTAKKPILSVDYDWKERKAFWVSMDSEGIGWSSLDHKTKGTLIRGVRADSVAVDWLGRNLYWIDGVSSQIIAVGLTKATNKAPQYCIILDEDLEQPRSLALLPQKGLMFWTEIGNEVKIERAGMDGSERRAVVTTSLGWPCGVAVDFLSDRVYWTDERLGAIGSATLDGEDIQILQMKEMTKPFSVSVFNDQLYWSDAKRRTVQVADKITGKNHQILFKRPRQPFGIKIIHPLLQRGPENPCENMQCSHLCVLTPGLQAVCKCPPGLLLTDDALTCSNMVNSAFLLLLSPSTVTQIHLQGLHTGVELNGWPEHLAMQLPNVNQAAIFDYGMRDHTLFVTDCGTTSLSLFKLKMTTLTPRGQLLKLLADTLTAMALDWTTGNVYWSSKNQPRLHVTSATGAHTAVLIKDGIGSLESTAVHPPSGRICFVNKGAHGKGPLATVECAHMDGSHRYVVRQEAVSPTSLVFSNEGEEIYWADNGPGVISSVKVDGSGYKEFKAGDGLAALALSDDMLLWVTSGDKTRLWFRAEQQQKNKMWFEVSTSVVSLKAYSKASQMGSNQCSINNGNCHHLCLANPGGRTCKCAHDHILMNGTHCAPQQSCPAGSRPCLDGVSCLPAEKFCSGHVDCPDHSDENCVLQKRGLGAMAVAPTKPRSSPPSPSEPPILHSPLTTNSTLNTSIQTKPLEAQGCSQSHCSGQGHCVESDAGDTSCVCSLGYFGDFCQDHLLKTMQGPIIYGTAGLVTALVVIAVLCAVFKKGKNANIRRASPVVKETSMTDLENKAEAALTTQHARTRETDKAEAASSVD